MADDGSLSMLTGHSEFDSAIARFSDIHDAAEQETARAKIWEQFGTEGAVFISDMASFSSTSRKIGVCHFLKMIHRARQIFAPLSQLTLWAWPFDVTRTFLDDVARRRR